MYLFTIIETLGMSQLQRLVLGDRDLEFSLQILSDHEVMLSRMKTGQSWRVVDIRELNANLGPNLSYLTRIGMCSVSQLQEKVRAYNRQIAIPKEATS